MDITAQGTKLTGKDIEKLEYLGSDNLKQNEARRFSLFP